MVIIARVGAIEVEVDDEHPGTIHYTPEYIADLARRLGREAVAMYDAIPAQHKHEG